MYRIVKETLPSGKSRYIVQKNTTFLGLIKIWWHTDTIMHVMCDGTPVSTGAIFDTLEEAKRYCGVYNKTYKREIVYKSDN